MRGSRAGELIFVIAVNIQLESTHIASSEPMLMSSLEGRFGCDYMLNMHIRIILLCA
jgi:hypothetical protein